MSDEGKRLKKGKVSTAEEVKVTSAEKAKGKLVRKAKQMDRGFFVLFDCFCTRVLADVVD